MTKKRAALRWLFTDPPQPAPSWAEFAEGAPLGLDEDDGDRGDGLGLDKDDGDRGDGLGVIVGYDAAACYLGVSRRQLSRMVRSGEIHIHKTKSGKSNKQAVQLLA